MIKEKEFTEYNRDQKDFTKKPLFKNYKENIFPPKSKVEKSEDQNASVLPATPKLSMRKKAQEDESLGDVWKLETPEEDMAAENLNFWIDEAFKGDEDAQRYLEEVFEEGWESAKKKLETESSAWYVWYMDGVRKFMRMQAEGEKEASIKLRHKKGAWETKPKGWTGKSMKSFWNSLGGSVSSCMEKMKGKVKDAGAYCASLERKVESSTENFKKFSIKKSAHWVCPHKCIAPGGEWEGKEDVMVAIVDDDLEVLIDAKTGKSTNRFSDGTVGVPEELQRFAEESEMVYCPFCNEEATWIHEKVSNIKVGDKILTSSKKVAKVIKVGAELCFWISLDGKDVGSEFIDSVEPFAEEGLVKEIPLEEKVGSIKKENKMSLIIPQDMRKKSFKKRARFFQDLPEEWQNEIFEGLKKDLRQDAIDEGYNPDDEDAMWEYVDNHINVNNTKIDIHDWLERYCDL